MVNAGLTLVSTTAALAGRGAPRPKLIQAVDHEVKMVGVRGFEPPAPASRRQCSTRLSYTPTEAKSIDLLLFLSKSDIE